MSEPTTEAGRRHLAKYAAIESCTPQIDALVTSHARDDILAIEAEARDSARASDTALRWAAQRLVDTTVLVPMEVEDDDSPSEFWCVHPEALADLRAALASPEEQGHG